MKAMLLVAAVAAMVPLCAFSQAPQLYSPNGQYLGNLSSNQYDPNSVSNPYGRYGSQYSAESINNPYGRYGSQYSNESARNPYATTPPIIVTPPSGYQGYQGYGN